MIANPRATLALILMLVMPTLAQADWARYKARHAKRDQAATTAQTQVDELPASLDDLPPPQAGGRMSNTLSLAMNTGTAPEAKASKEVPAERPLVAPLPSLTLGESLARFDLAVSNAPAARVFAQLGVGSPYNVLVSPEVVGNISVQLKSTTVPEALETLRDLFGYDFRITGNRVFVYPNTVQMRMFRVNYLPGRRQGASDLRVSSSSITQSGGSNSSGNSSNQTQGSSNNSGSGSTGTRALDSSSVRMTSDTDFWREVQDSLVAMVGTQNGRSVTINAGAGVIVVRATPLELRHVADYLRAVQLTIERQVMLEAKIVEVQLTKSAQSGVNWSLFKGIGGGARAGIINTAPGLSLSRTGNFANSDVTISPGNSVTTEALGQGFYGLAVQAANFSALISFLETQGEVQVLSSPRIATLNNQKAVLKVGSDELFVTGVTSNTTTTSSGNTVASPTLTLQPFFSGISLDVTPQIDEAGTVMLHVHPSVSVVSEKQKVIDLGSQGTFKLPLATSSINETDSIVRVHDGHIVAIGGLMTQGATRDSNGVPGLSDVPVMGALFRQRSSSDSKHELVILIRPTIIEQDESGWDKHMPQTPLLGSAR